MSLTHQDLAGLTAALYGEAGAPAVAWLYRSNPDANVVFGIVRIDGYLIIVYRGSYTGLDWLHDVLVEDIDPVGRPTFKRIHSGFYSGTVEAWDLVAMFLEPGDKVIFIGHSLGGARAEIGAETMVAVLGRPPHLVVVWGEPAPFKPSPMAAPAYPFVIYRNVVDGTPDAVTHSTDIVGYRHRAAFTDMSVPPTSGLLLAEHHFPLYAAGTPATAIP